MPKHVWAWDKKSENPMYVACVNCGQRELLRRVLNGRGCDACLVEGRQGALFNQANTKVGG